MATAKISTVEVEKVVVTQVSTYQLNINKAELQALLWVLNRVGGDPDSTPRGKIANIMTALREFGVPEARYNAQAGLCSLYFGEKL